MEAGGGAGLKGPNRVAGARREARGGAPWWRVDRRSAPPPRPPLPPPLPPEHPRGSPQQSDLLHTQRWCCRCCSRRTSAKARPRVWRAERSTSRAAAWTHRVAAWTHGVAAWVHRVAGQVHGIAATEVRSRVVACAARCHGGGLRRAARRARGVACADRTGSSHRAARRRASRPCR